LKSLAKELKFFMVRRPMSLLLEAWKPVGCARITGRIKIAESSITFISFWASVMCQEETSESLEGVFPGGMINHGKNGLERFDSLYKLRGSSNFSEA